MHARTLGNTGIEVSEVGMGCNRLAETGQTESYWIDLVREATDLGVTIFDTAEAYQKGGSEEILGKALGNRDDVYIATKVGGSVGKDFSPERIKAACETSLKRLRRDRIDIYQLHSPNRADMEKHAWATALEALQNEGKIGLRAIAVNSVEDGIWLMEQNLVEALQITYNLLEISAAEQLFPLAKEKGVALLCRLPLAQGILSGKFSPGQEVPNDNRAARAGERMHERIERAETLKPLGAAYDGGLTRLAHHFSLSADAVSCIIPGARTSEQLHQNIAASNGGALDAEWKERVEAVQKTWG
ncbi:MAG: aryl-alcohol dehydrogenase-like predicted oxidoreductase [Candidatus Latescibacterota bacterium]|jgi:aryl-alcohol dehydrogenase-like predicted oxidoreductase